MTTVAKRHGWLAPTRALFVFVVSCVVAVAIAVALATLADTFGWCCVHGWALAHGTGFAVLLFGGLVGFHIARTFGVLIGFLPREPQWGLLSHTSYVASAVSTLVPFVPLGPLALVGVAAGLIAVYQRVRGRQIAAFSLAVVGLLTGLLWSLYLASFGMLLRLG